MKIWKYVNHKACVPSISNIWFCTWRFILVVTCFKCIFRHPDDIDLFAGGISETPDKGSILGPTFQCLIAYQFSLYKQGDRFWYERKFQENPVAAFTKGIQYKTVYVSSTMFLLFFHLILMQRSYLNWSAKCVFIGTKYLSQNNLN